MVQLKLGRKGFAGGLMSSSGNSRAYWISES